MTRTRIFEGERNQLYHSRVLFGHNKCVEEGKNPLSDSIVPFELEVIVTSPTIQIFKFSVESIDDSIKYIQGERKCMGTREKIKGCTNFRKKIIYLHHKKEMFHD